MKPPLKIKVFLKDSFVPIRMTREEYNAYLKSELLKAQIKTEKAKEQSLRINKEYSQTH